MTSTRATIDAMREQLSQLLHEQCARGRGLWVGLFTDGPLHLMGWRVDAPHCTLVHFGRRRSIGVATAAVDAAEWVSTMHPFDVKIHAVARFSSADAEGNPVVALVEGRELHDAHGRAESAARDSLIAEREQAIASGATTLLDVSRAWLPHVTLGRCPADAPLSVGPIERSKIAISRVGVVCGDARYLWSLS